MESGLDIKSLMHILITVPVKLVSPVRIIVIWKQRGWNSGRRYAVHLFKMGAFIFYDELLCNGMDKGEDMENVCRKMEFITNIHVWD